MKIVLSDSDRAYFETVRAETVESVGSTGTINSDVVQDLANDMLTSVWAGLVAFVEAGETVDEGMERWERALLASQAELVRQR